MELPNPKKENMSNPIEIVRSFYAALDRGDISGALATLHDELEWTEAERAPYYSGTWHSPEEVCDKLFVPLLHDWEGLVLWYALGENGKCSALLPTWKMHST
jgi:hypothetical protein